jgi:mannan endo-1,4-beta-mannosidase
VRGSRRITEDDVSTKTVEARLQAPRALWDSTYREKSWIDAQWGKPIRLIPWLSEKIAKQYPGTKLSMTEYNFGAPGHISGALAQVDALGVFGREGLVLASYWGNGSGVGPLPDYIAAAFRLYRNYDGKGGTFGDTSVSARAPDVTKASVFAATDSKHPGQLTVVVINKDLRANYAGTLVIQGSTKYRIARAYRIDKKGPRVEAREPAIDIHDNRLSVELPPLSATLLVCDAQ